MAGKDDSTHEYVVVIDPALHRLFERHQFTYLDKTIRQGLSGKPLAQWLHAFYSTHAAPYPLTADYLRRLSGSANADLKSFRQKLRRALGDVALVSRLHGRDFSATWHGDTVHVIASRPGRWASDASPAEGVPSDGIPQLVHRAVAEDTECRRTGYEMPS